MGAWFKRQMLKRIEAIFWRTLAWVLGTLLIISVVANSLQDKAVPYSITLFLCGCLVALGIGNAIINPRSSPVMLTEHEEAQFRRRQYVVGFTISATLAVLILLTELRSSMLVWLFAPIIAVPFVLVIRERVTK